MAFTIYTVSDPGTVGAALQSMAMFFGQDGWVGSAIKTGLILSLLFILAQGVTRNGLRLDVMIIQLLVVWAMFMPKTTVTVEQFDNAAPPRVVDDVPYAIAVPASVAGAFALYMTNKIEAVMVNVDGDYLSISGGSHPFTPARALMAITMCPSDPMSCVDQNLVETMRLAARFCAGRELSTIDFRVKSDVLGAFADTLTQQAQVVIYDAANPYIPGGGGGRVASCPEAAGYLKAVAESERAGTGAISKAMNGLANRSEIKRYNSIARAQDNTERTWDEALNDINKLRDANSKMDSLAFANVTLYALADTMKYSASAPIDQAITLRRDSSLFEWAKNEAHQSMLVSTTAPKFMDILFFVFIASTPIVMFVVAANPSGGLKVAGSYALFGLWTQSWIPMMAIIMSWYQGEIRNISSPNAFTPEYMAFFMRHAYTSTIAASNMIQQAPYLMFAIMTGSMFALSGMVSKSMPSGKGDASETLKGSGSGGGGTGADVMNPASRGGIPGAGMRHAIYGGQAAMAGGMTAASVGISGDGSAALPGIAKLDASGSVQAASSHAREQSAAARQQIQSQSQQAYSELSSLVQSAAKKIGGAQMAQHMQSAGFDASFDARTGMLTTQYGSFDVSGKQTNSTLNNAGLQGVIALKTNESLAGKVANLATGFSASAAVTTGIAMKNQQDVSAGHANGARSSTDAGTGSAVRTNSGSAASSGVTGTSGAEWSDMASKAKNLQNTFSKLASQSESLDRVDKAMQQATASAATSVGQQVDGGQVVTNWGSQVSNRFGNATGNDGVALDRIAGLVHSSLTPGQQESFRNQAAARMGEMHANGSSLGLSRDQVAMAAGWSTLASMSATAQRPDDKIAAQLGMAQLAKAAGAGDMTAPLQAARTGLNQVKDVAQGISEIGSRVQPAASSAAAQADKKVGSEAANAFGSQVDKQIATQKATAQALNGAAQAGVSTVKAQGQEKLDLARKQVDAASVVDTNSIVAATNKARDNQSAIPVGNDITQFGFGNNTSLNHKLLGDPKAGANDGSLGPRNASPVQPAQTLPGLAGDAVQKGAELAGSTMNSLGSAVTGATGQSGLLSGAIEKGAGISADAMKSLGGAIDKGKSLSESAMNSLGNAATGGNGLPGLLGGATEKGALLSNDTMNSLSSNVSGATQNAMSASKQALAGSTAAAPQVLAGGERQASARVAPSASGGAAQAAEQFNQQQGKPQPSSGAGQDAKPAGGASGERQASARVAPSASGGAAQAAEQFNQQQGKPQPSSGAGQDAKPAGGVSSERQASASGGNGEPQFSKTLSGAVGGAVEKGMGLSANAMGTVGSIASGAVEKIQGAASSVSSTLTSVSGANGTGNGASVAASAASGLSDRSDSATGTKAGALDTSSAPTSSTSTVIIQGGGGSSLPELGGGAGLNLSAPAGGGVALASPSSTPSPSSKPSVAARANKKDGGASKPKTPGR